MDIASVRDYLLGLQQRIVDDLQSLELATGGRPFVTDGWLRAPGERLQGDPVARRARRASRSR